ncbi:hypothetical protein SANTM175S_03733 [Streptomyces antimycoticus]
MESSKPWAAEILRALLGSGAQREVEVDGAAGQAGQTEHAQHHEHQRDRAGDDALAQKGRHVSASPPAPDRPRRAASRPRWRSPGGTAPTATVRAGRAYEPGRRLRDRCVLVGEHIGERLLPGLAGERVRRGDAPVEVLGAEGGLGAVALQVLTRGEGRVPGLVAVHDQQRHRPDTAGQRTQLVLKMGGGVRHAYPHVQPHPRHLVLQGLGHFRDSGEHAVACDEGDPPVHRDPVGGRLFHQRAGGGLLVRGGGEVVVVAHHTGRDQLRGGLGQSAEKSADDALAVDGHADRLAHPDVVERRLTAVQPQGGRLVVGVGDGVALVGARVVQRRRDIGLALVDHRGTDTRIAPPDIPGPGIGRSLPSNRRCGQGRSRRRSATT